MQHACARRMDASMESFVTGYEITNHEARHDGRRYAHTEITQRHSMKNTLATRAVLCAVPGSEYSTFFLPDTRPGSTPGRHAGAQAHY
jgi:hypothetical protein